jgi:hypothetical protein
LTRCANSDERTAAKRSHIHRTQLPVEEPM